MATRSPAVNVMTKAAYKAAKGMLRDFGEVEQLQVSMKGPADFVSTADTQAERIIVSELKKARPEYGLVTEEDNPVEGTDASGRRWIVDPIDGTTNFLHGIPHFCISIALEERGDIVAGVVYDPTKDELFWADRGNGAYLNDRRIRVSSRQQLSQCLFATGIPFLGRGDHDAYADQMKAVIGVSSRSADSEPRRLISPMWRPDGSTVSGRRSSASGTSQRVCCWFGRRAATSPTSRAAITA